MGYLDNELDQQQRQQLESHLRDCKTCREELEDFRKLIAVTSNVDFVEPEDKLWKQYWNNTYNRLERGIGWVLFSVSAICFLIYGGFKLIENIIKDPALGLAAKIGLACLLAGLAVLIVSVSRERWFFWKNDRYKDVRR
jgi:predicted anti-sigma-YlaC factor YlaD